MAWFSFCYIVSALPVYLPKSTDQTSLTTQTFNKHLFYRTSGDAIGNDYVLDLRHQKIITLEDTHLRNKTSYHTIDLSNSGLEMITPHLLENLHNLSNLKADGNEKFRNRNTGSFLYVKSLTLFSCIGCGFKEIYEQSFTGLPNMETLDLSKNLIASIGKDAFTSNSNLKFLNFSANALDTIRPDTFRSNKHLSVLDLSSNTKLNVTEGTQLIINTNLEVLHVSRCNFNVIDEKAFSGLPNLREVYLQHNAIHKVNAGAFKLNPLLTNISFENNTLEQLPLSVITDQTKNLCLDLNHFKLTRGYVRLYSKYERHKLVRDANTTICENRNETLQFEWLVMKQLNVTRAGISDAFISMYILVVVLAEVVVLVLLIFCFMKMSKKFKPDDLSQTILNGNSIYKLFKND